MGLVTGKGETRGLEESREWVGRERGEVERRDRDDAESRGWVGRDDRRG